MDAAAASRGYNDVDSATSTSTSAPASASASAIGRATCGGGTAVAEETVGEASERKEGGESAAAWPSIFRVTIGSPARG